MRPTRFVPVYANDNSNFTSNNLLNFSEINNKYINNSGIGVSISLPQTTVNSTSGNLTFYNCFLETLNDIKSNAPIILTDNQNSIALQNSKASVSNGSKITFTKKLEFQQEKNLVQKISPHIQKRPSLQQNNDNNNGNLEENLSNNN